MNCMVLARTLAALGGAPPVDRPAKPSFHGVTVCSTMDLRQFGCLRSEILAAITCGMIFSRDSAIGKLATGRNFGGDRRFARMESGTVT